MFKKLSNPTTVADFVLVEKLKSVFRTVIQFSGLITATLAALKLDIPLITSMIKSIGYLNTNLDGVAAAVTFIIGIGITIYGFFKNPERFEANAEVKMKSLSHSGRKG
jgi:hypothetical protein